MIDKALLDILSCPVCKGLLVYDEDKQALSCKPDCLSFAVPEHWHGSANATLDTDFSKQLSHLLKTKHDR